MIGSTVSNEIALAVVAPTSSVNHRNKTIVESVGFRPVLFESSD